MEDSTKKGKNASELFPGLVPDDPKPQEPQTVQRTTPKTEAAGAPAAYLDSDLPAPPPPPDITWLKTGQLQEKMNVSDTPTALAITTDETARNHIDEAIQEFGYQAEFLQSEEEAIERIKHLTPTIMIFHAKNVQGSIEDSKFHNYLCGLPMSKRRNILYIIINEQSRTLYNLEALTYSANMVINDKDMEHLAVIIRKGLHEHHKLFGPLTEAIQLRSK